MIYTGEHLNAISFPLGGIGTGSIGLRGNGQLFDWEIFNRPNKGSLNGYSHIAVKLKKDGKTYVKVLQGDTREPLTGQYSKSVFGGFGYGPRSQSMCGFPHFRNVAFDGAFPIASLRFTDEDFPGAVTLTAFNPFIPLDSKNSSIPAAFFEISYENVGDTAAELEVIFSLANPSEASRNETVVNGSVTSVFLGCANRDPDHLEYKDMTLSCEAPDVVQEYWYRGGWQDGIVMFWNEFSSETGIKPRTYDTHGSYDTCSLSKRVTISSGETGKCRFAVSWNAPNMYNYWGGGIEGVDLTKHTWKNYYATVFRDSADSGRYALENWDSLYERTLRFRDELFASTLDPVILDAISATISVLKSPTVFRLENGEFYGFEGVHEQAGSCHGSCQHVWNYAYALCFLFPDLERSMRDLEFRYATYPNGETIFRLPLPLTVKPSKFRPCVDGQMGTVIKTYREWKISGKDDWLRENWSTVERIMDYAWNPENGDEWDLNRDGVLEGRQHHTLDMELFGPSAWLQGFYLGALKAAAEMAEYMGYPEKAAEYRDIFERGRVWTKEHLFNGEYFIQRIDLTDKSIPHRFGCADTYWNAESGEIKYQIAEGCDIDQLCGQWHANLCGLGDLFDKDQRRTALLALFRHNYKPSMRTHTNPWRIFALNDEAGAIICDYPEGAYKPRIPIPYCEESMHGFEYQLAGLLMSEGFYTEGLTVVRSIRDRYNGKNRNPWNEIECGSNYARSMASFALLPLLSGFSFDLPHGRIGFDPKVKRPNFRAFWCLGTGWGNFRITETGAEINLVSGELSLSAVELPFLKNVRAVRIDGAEVPFTAADGVIAFARTRIRNKIEFLA